jgi:flagellar motor protein MotB
LREYFDGKIMAYLSMDEQEGVPPHASFQLPRIRLNSQIFESFIEEEKMNHSRQIKGAETGTDLMVMVTAMMALFIVLWIMSQSQSIRQNVAQYFKNPGLLPGATGLMETSDMGGEMPTPGHSQDLQRPAPIKPDLSYEKNTLEKNTLEEVKKRIT